MNLFKYSARALVASCVIGAGAHAALPVQMNAAPAAPSPERAAPAVSAPTSEVMAEYERRLFPAPSCLEGDGCAQVQSARLSSGAGGLELTLEVHAQARSAIKLPSLGGAQWRISGNGSPMLAKLPDGSIGALAEPGVSKMTLGIAEQGSEIILSFAKPPKFLSKSLTGWSVIAPEQGALSSIKIVRSKTAIESKVDASNDAAQSAKFDAPLFLDVRKNIVFDATGADITLSATRLSPAEKPASASIALAEGEKIVAEGVVVDGRQAKLDFAAGQSTATLRSRWDYKGALSLVAAEAADRRETWSIEPWSKAPLKFEGLSPITSSESSMSLLFLPFPGQKVSMTATPIVPAAGAQIAIDNSVLTQSTGEDKSQLSWTMKARSTIAAPLELSAPTGWTLESATNNGQIASPSKKGEKYVVDLVPGSNALVLNFRQERDAGMLAKSPDIGVSAPVANSHWKMSIPANRWVVLAWGPLMGPAILIWGVLLAMVGLGYALSRFIKAEFAPSFSGWIAVLVPLSALSPWSALIVVLFVFLLDIKQRHHERISTSNWNGAQLGLMILGVLSAAILLSGVYAGLLGLPNMMVVGNGSSAQSLNWYEDKAQMALDVSSGLSAGAVLAPVWLWRAIMLGWALWMASAIAKRVPPLWAAMTLGGFWRESIKPAAPKKQTQPVAVKKTAVSSEPLVDNRNNSSDMPKGEMMQSNENSALPDKNK